MKDERKVICVLCGQEWLPEIKNRCECGGFCTWGYAPNKPESFTVDEKGKELLLHLESEINDLLGRPDVIATPVHPSTLKRLEESLDHFEISHPELTTLLARLLESLSNVGI